MPEGATIAGGQVAAGVHDDRDSPPAPDPVQAPKGWTWNRSSRSWQPRRRGPNLATAAPVPSPAADGQRSTAVDSPLSPGEDPAPGWQADDGPGAGSPTPPDERPSFETVPQQVKDDIAGLAGLVGAPLLSFLKAVDPYCAGALADNYEDVIDATLPLMCRSQKVVDYFTGDKSDWLLWGKLAITLKPVAVAIAEHHVLRTVEIVKDKDTGAITFERTERGRGGAHHGSPLQPQVVDPVRYAA